jgi:hypothetical protein
MQARTSGKEARKQVVIYSQLCWVSVVQLFLLDYMAVVAGTPWKDVSVRAEQRSATPAWISAVPSGAERVQSTVLAGD